MESRSLDHLPFRGFLSTQLRSVAAEAVPATDVLRGSRDETVRSLHRLDVLARSGGAGKRRSGERGCVIAGSGWGRGWGVAVRAGREGVPPCVVSRPGLLLFRGCF